MGEIELFRCEALRARITKAQCQRNQALAAKQAAGKDVRFGRRYPLGVLNLCLKCVQKEELDGRTIGDYRIVAPTGQDIGEVENKPRNDIEEKNFVAATKEVTSSDPVKYCKNHPDRPVFERKGGLPLSICKECLIASLKAGHLRAKEKLATTGEIGTAATARDIKVNASVVLDFSGRESLLKAIEELAAEEERSVGGQIMYWLKKHLREEL